MNLVLNICFALLFLAASGTVVRLIRPGSAANRAVALDMLTIVIAAGLAVHAVRFDTDDFLDGAIVVTLLGFVSMVSVARFVEGRKP